MRGGWVFLTNHALVLVAISRDPEARLRDIAEQVGLTERGVFDIVDDLRAAGYLTKEKVGRRVRYDVHPPHGMRRPAAQLDDLHRLVELVAPAKRRTTSARNSPG